MSRMSGNLDNDRTVTTGKMYPIDLAPQKITIVKSVTNSEVKMAHLMTNQPKNTGSSQLGSHASAASGIMRSGLAQILSPSASSQAQMIVSGSPILQGSQIISQGTQLHNPGPQILSHSQLLASGQILSPGTQIISQGTQLSAQVSNSSNIGAAVTSISQTSGAQVLNVGSQLGASNLMVNSSVRTLPPTVRVLPPLSHHNNRPASVQLSSVSVSSANNVLVSKSVNVGVTSHVPRGLAAGASLALRPVTPSSVTQPASNQVGTWGGARAGRGALVYGGRARAPHTPSSQHQPHSNIVSLPTASVINSNTVISGTVRGVGPRAPTPTPAPVVTGPRPLPLLQRNYQPAKVVGVSSVGVRGVVGNSAPTQLYYEVPRATTTTQPPMAHHSPRPLTPYNHSQPQPQQMQTQVTVVNAAVSALSENRPQPTSVSVSSVLARPTILRKRDLEGSPTKSMSTVTYPSESTGWEDVGTGGVSGGSTTMSASSSPHPDDEPDPPRDVDLSPRKKPRKQLLSNDVRQCEYPAEDVTRSPPPAVVNPPPKRPLLSSSYVCGWRSTALHFLRPGDVRRREPKPRDIVAIAGQKHVLTSAEGWKVHHLTAQMDDLMSLESDVGDQLAGLLRALETASGKAINALQPHSHAILELLKGNIQRSKIVCEGIQEARVDILRVFTHRKSVSDILARQADKRCFRKHRSQS